MRAAHNRGALPDRGDASGSALSARVACVWSTRIVRSSPADTWERGLREHWLVHIQNLNNSMWIFARRLVSAFGNNQKEKSRVELRVEISHRRHENVVFPDQPPRGQQSLKLYIFFSLLLKIKKSKHIFSLSTQDLCAKGTERRLPGIDPWHMQVSESAVLQIPAQRVLSPPCGAVIIVFDILYFSKTP